MPSPACSGAAVCSSAKKAAPVYILGLGMPAAAHALSLSCNHTAEHPLLAFADVLIGGRRQLAAFADHPAEKLLVGADTASLYERMQANRNMGRLQLVLCSGDPLFFGLGARLAEHFAPGDLRILPGLSSLQAAAAFLGMAWENMESVSLHGRTSYLPLAHALIRAEAGAGPVFVLTDAGSSPSAVAAFMTERGHSRYSMHVMGNLYAVPDRRRPGASAPPAAKMPHSRIQAEYYIRLTPEQALCLLPPEQQGRLQLVILLEPQPGARQGCAAFRPFGVPDALLATENTLLTKAPVRAAGLAALRIEPGHTVWDLGAGSGAVSIEAARLAWRGRVIAVEAAAERIALIEKNRQNFGAANLEIVHGAMPGILDRCLAAYSRPQRIFFGGGLNGRTEDAADADLPGQIFRKAWNALLPGGRMLIHCVLLSTLECARALLARTGATAEVSCIQVSQSVPLAGDIRLQALNPVFLVSADKPENAAVL